MQIRCNVCSTIVTIGDDVARALAKRGGSVPCRNCKAPILVSLPSGGVSTTSGNSAASVAARTTAPNAAGPAARAPAPHPGQARPAAPNAAPIASRPLNAAPVAAPPPARLASAPGVAQLGGATSAPRSATPGVAASRAGRLTLPFGPSPGSPRDGVALSGGTMAPAGAATAAAAAPAPTHPVRNPAPAPRVTMPSVSGGPQRVAHAAPTRSAEPVRAVAQPAARPATPTSSARHAATAEPATPSAKRAAPPPPRLSVTETPPERTDRSSHRPIPPLPALGPERLRAWVHTQSTGLPRVEPRPPSNSRASLEREAIASSAARASRPDAAPPEVDDDDDRPTRRPPPVAELAKGVFDQARYDFEPSPSQPARDERWGADARPVSVEPEPYTGEIESIRPEPLSDETALPDDAAPVDDEFPTLPPTRADPIEDDGDDDPTIVEPYGYFGKEDRSTEHRPVDERPTDRSLRAAAAVGVDARPSPPNILARSAGEQRVPPEPPPAPRIGTARGIPPTSASYPDSAGPAVRVPSAGAAPVPPAVSPLAGSGSISAVAMQNQQGFSAAIPSQAAPSAPPAAPTFSSAPFRAAQHRTERSKVTNFAGGIVALLVVSAAGYFGAMSGKAKAPPPDAVPTAETAVAKVDPLPPVATAVTRRDPPPAPSPSVEAPPPARAREVPTEPPPARRDTVRESPPPRRTASEDEPARARPSSETARPTRNRAPRPPPDEENSGNTAPETRLPDSNDAPAARGGIDQGALRAAFAEGEAKAKSCLGASSPSGTARISVTFVPSGEAAGAIVMGAPFANTIEGQCMAAKFRTLHVPPFMGVEVIVRKSINFL